MVFIWCQKFPVLPYTFEVTYPKHAASFHQHGEGSLRRPLSLHPSLLPLLHALENRLWYSVSHLRVLMPAKILFWPTPGRRSAPGANPAHIPAASTFLMTLDPGHFCTVQNSMTLQYSGLVAWVSCLTPHPLLCLFFEDFSSPIYSSLQRAAAPWSPFPYKKPPKLLVLEQLTTAFPSSTKIIKLFCYIFISL